MHCVVKLYDDGYSIAKISKIVGLSPYKIKKIILQSGRSIRRHNYQSLGIEQKANELYESGLSTYEIAEMLGCSDETVRRKVSVRPESERNTRSAESRKKIGESCAAKWSEDEYRCKVKAATSTPEYREALSLAAQRHGTLRKWVQSDAGKLSISERVKQQWRDPEYYTKQSVYFAERAANLRTATARMLADPVRRAAWISKIRANNTKNRADQPRISSTQAQLYYILEDSSIAYYEESEDTRISPFYIVDCIIPQQQGMSKDLIVEVQGEYWHSLSHVKLKDRQKKTYITRHTNYDLVYLEELDMRCWDEVASKLLCYGLKLRSIDCTVQNLTIKIIDEVQARQFYSVFHYTNSVRKGAITFGVYYFDRLLAAISYTYPIRKEVAKHQGLSPGQVIEISRIARATNLRCDNLISWLIAKTRRQLSRDIKAVISFSDSSQGHTGGVYRACGFKNDGIVGKDYHYISAAGRYHKKTIWGMAKRFGMGEAEYANKHGLIRVEDGEKTRWVLK